MKWDSSLKDEAYLMIYSPSSKGVTVLIFVLNRFVVFRFGMHVYQTNTVKIIINGVLTAFDVA